MAGLKREIEDLRTTALTRAGRSPTGDIAPTVRTTPKPDTLLLQGQTLNRADYPGLWQWIEDQGLAPSVFGNGNGSTTFVLPDLRGRTLIGAGTLGPDNMAVGALVGTSRVTLSMDQMPAHDHDRADNHRHYVSPVDNHQHYFNTDQGGGHGGHIGGSVTRADGSFGTAAHPTGVGSPTHFHTGYTAFSGGHDHGYTSNSGTHIHTTQGAGAAIDARPPAVAVNWLIWT
ncbi:phage tail protein [Pseudonocardia parietis]|uniref:Microcystin-dependent protein n=1 Tax=Pseudonocardia parietis TaxID=570936 RepID=A0ABS4W1Y2_9PSEU|nr:tail fiber protein [Pseudonocardia parietis]MBP2370213.1 microcystin-dependent protein [Pseudonocardia parietis]